MEEIILRPTGQVPFAFVGDITEEWSCQYVNGVEQLRWHEISLYSITDSDEEILEIKYRTQWQREVGYTEFHYIDDELVVATLLQLYDPLLHLEGYPKGQEFEAKQFKLKQQLLGDWNRLKAEVYESLEISVPLPIAERPVEIPSSISDCLHREVLLEARKQGLSATTFIESMLLPLYLNKQS
jgi:hypothetical protein